MKIQNNKTKTYLVVGLTLVAMLVSSSSLSAVFAQVTTPNTVFNVQEDEIPRDIQQQVSKMPENSKHAAFLNIEKRVHGFSGMYLDDTGTLNVYTTDPSIKSVDKSILADYVNPEDLAKEVVVKQSKHSWHKWVELENIVLKLFDDRNFGVTMMGLDDKNQVYHIGFEKLDDSRKAFMTNFLAMHNIPQDMIQLIETGKLIPITGDDSTGNYAPVALPTPIWPGAEIGLVGAAHLGTWLATPHCTLGLIAKTSSGTTVGVTAGHCQGPNGLWNTRTQQYTQPYSTTPQNSQHTYPNNGRYVGTATTTTTNLLYSDSLLTSLTETSNFGKIYNGATYKTITGKFNSVAGSPVCYMGATSGVQKCGTITSNGQYLYDQGLGKYLYSQAVTNITPALGGDSGSPVYAYPNGDTTQTTVQFAGTAVCCKNSNMWYSPIQNIDYDQGTLTVK